MHDDQAVVERAEACCLDGMYLHTRCLHCPALVAERVVDGSR